MLKQKLNVRNQRYHASTSQRIQYWRQVYPDMFQMSSPFTFGIPGIPFEVLYFKCFVCVAYLSS